MSEAARVGIGVVQSPNGLKVKTKFLSIDDLDRRTAAYRKVTELAGAVEADLGGPDMLSTAERQIVRHAALTSAMVEDLGSRWLSGEPVDPSQFSALTNTEKRLYETVGLRRRAKVVGPSLGAMLQQDFERQRTSANEREAAQRELEVQEP
jgi:hypothetical protein